MGNDGSQKHFLVQTSLTPSARSDERMVQLFRVLNRLLDKHKESRRRHLAFNTPIIIPVWPQVWQLSNFYVVSGDSDNRSLCILEFVTVILILFLSL